MKKILFSKHFLINSIAILFTVGMIILAYFYFAGSDSKPVLAHSAANYAKCHYWYTIGRGDCGGCGFLERYFGKRVWAAREICSFEGYNVPTGEPCSNEATGVAEVGCFQIHTIHCGGTFICPMSGDVVALSSNISNCDTQLRNSHNNAVVACALSNSGTDWTPWSVASPIYCNIPSPPAEQYRNPQ